MEEVKWVRRDDGTQVAEWKKTEEKAPEKVVLTGKRGRPRKEDQPPAGTPEYQRWYYKHKSAKSKQYMEKQKQRNLRWQKDNPEKVREIQKAHRERVKQELEDLRQGKGFRIRDKEEDGE